MGFLKRIKAFFSSGSGQVPPRRTPSDPSLSYGAVIELAPAKKVQISKGVFVEHLYTCSSPAPRSRPAAPPRPREDVRTTATYDPSQDLLTAVLLNSVLSNSDTGPSCADSSPASSDSGYSCGGD